MSYSFSSQVNPSLVLFNFPLPLPFLPRYPLSQVHSVSFRVHESLDLRVLIYRNGFVLPVSFPLASTCCFLDPVVLLLRPLPLALDIAPFLSCVAVIIAPLGPLPGLPENFSGLHTQGDGGWTTGSFLLTVPGSCTSPNIQQNTEFPSATSSLTPQSSRLSHLCQPNWCRERRSASSL